MSLDMEAIRSAIAFCVPSGVQVKMPHEKQGFFRAGAGAAFVEFEPITIVGPNRDDIRRTHNTGTDEIDVLHCGHRVCTLRITIQADQLITAQQIGENIRTKIYFAAPRRTLQLAGISLAQVLSVVNRQFSWDNRVVSACYVDLQINFVVNEADESITYIEKVNNNEGIHGTIEGGGTGTIET